MRHCQRELPSWRRYDPRRHALPVAGMGGAIMGYFSNGTEGMVYQSVYCEKCYHDRDNKCPVWWVHLLWVGKGNDDTQSILDDLIPLSEDGCWNQQCAMFLESVRVKEGA